MTFSRLSIPPTAAGTLPPDLNASLTHLDLANNTIKGTVPSELGMLGELTLLDLSSNDFEGVVPSELGLLTKLTYLKGLEPVLGDRARNLLGMAQPWQLRILFEIDTK